jgi:uncharacterized protein
MNTLLVKNLDKPLSSPLQVKYCKSFFCRMLGFMFSKHIEKETGILLVQSRDSRVDSSIHMFFVFTDLAVSWINEDHVVVDRVLARSWKPIYIPKAPARYVLEINPDRLEDFHVGDHVEFINV